MGKSVTTDACLRLHVHHGDVWAATGKSLPRPIGLGPQRIRDHVTSYTPTVRVAGVPESLEMVCRLWELKQEGLIGSLQMVTPLVCNLACDREDPAKLLNQTYRPLLAPSQGGCHEVSEDQIEIYRCASYPSLANVDRFSRLPLGRALTFSANVNLRCCLQIITQMVDPRWFVDTSRPDRTSKLESYFGLNYKTQAGVLKLKPAWRHHRRCELVNHSWSTGWQPSAQSYVNLDSFGPGEFVFRAFWRHWASVENDAEKRVVKAYLRASQRFLRFMRLVWLDFLYAGSTSIPDGRAGLFRPTDWFDTELEAESFRLHVAASP